MAVVTTASCSLTFPSQPHRRRPLPPRAAGDGDRGEAAVEIRVCVNRTCARQGARETLAALAGLAPPLVAVASCGCLGRCGAGPNAAAVVAGGAALFGHLGTAARAAQLLEHLLSAGEFDAAAGLAALAASKKAEAALDNGSAAEAEALLSQAIGLGPNGGLHLMYKSRSSARLAMGNVTGALADAEEAIRIAPKFPQAYLMQGDAFLAMVECDAAENAYATALDLDPSLRRSNSFKARVAKLREKLVNVKSSS